MANIEISSVDDLDKVEEIVGDQVDWQRVAAEVFRTILEVKAGNRVARMLGVPEVPSEDAVTVISDRAYQAMGIDARGLLYGNPEDPEEEQENLQKSDPEEELEVTSEELEELDNIFQEVKELCAIQGFDLVEIRLDPR